MGHVKDDLLQEEEEKAYAFSERARRNDWCCRICGNLIEEHDESIYYLTRMCGLHAHLMDKDD